MGINNVAVILDNMVGWTVVLVTPRAVAAHQECLLRTLESEYGLVIQTS